MPPRVLVTGAGSGASNNLIRDLRSGDSSLAIVGCHHDRFVLKKSPCERNYLVVSPWRTDYLASLRRVVSAERIDVLVPTTDAEVRAVARSRRTVGCRSFLPPAPVVALCQDKFVLSTRLRARAVPAPRTYAVTSLAAIPSILERLGRPRRVWCRMRTGNGALGAIPVRDAAQARAWVGYWHDMRGVAVRTFTLSEYLPGRDFFCQGHWRRGRVVLIKTCERLSYFGGGGQPSGISSVSALSRTVVAPRVVEVCAAAIRALGRGVSGTFNFDLKEDAEGVPCVTEINAGRFASGTALLDLAGAHNMAHVYVRLALGEPVEIPEPYDAPEDYYSVRDLDALPGVFDREQLFQGIDDARE